MKAYDKDLLKKYLSGDNMDLEREKDRELVEKILASSKEWKTEADDDIESSLRKFKSKVDKSKKETRIISLQTLIKIAAIIVIGVGLSLYIFNQPELTNYTTSNGERIEITLPDKSIVFLDAQSSLSYDDESWGENRAIELSGKAYFEVEKGAPFVITTDMGEVSVLGTSFTINDRDTSYFVECYTGSVAVKSNLDNLVITSGETVKLTGSNLAKSNFRIEKNKEWVSGQVYFEEASLQLVFDEIRRQFNINLITGTINGLFYSGSIDLNQSALQNLEKISLIMGLKLENKNNEIIISQDLN